MPASNTLRSRFEVGKTVRPGWRLVWLIVVIVSSATCRPEFTHQLAARFEGSHSPTVLCARETPKNPWEGCEEMFTSIFSSAISLVQDLVRDRNDNISRVQPREYLLFLFFWRKHLIAKRRMKTTIGAHDPLWSKDTLNRALEKPLVSIIADPGFPKWLAWGVRVKVTISEKWLVECRQRAWYRHAHSFQAGSAS